MEFLIFLSAIFQFCYPEIQRNYGFNTLPVWAAFAIAGALYLVVYGFRAAGLFVMAKKAGRKKLVWCAFVPFASTYLIGELGGDMRFGGVKVKHIGIIALVAEFIYTFCGVFVISWLGYFFASGSYILTPVTNSAGDILYYTSVLDGVSVALQRTLNVFNVLQMIFSIIQLLVFVFLNIAFFRKYSPVSFIWMVLLCALVPIVEAFLIFAFRNRKPIDYDAYMRARAEQARRMQQAQYGPYGQGGPYGQNPYGGPYNRGPYGQNPYGQNPYGTNPNANAPSEPDDPFGEFSSPRPQQPPQGQSGNANAGRGNGEKKDDDDFFS